MEITIDDRHAKCTKCSSLEIACIYIFWIDDGKHMPKSFRSQCRKCGKLSYGDFSEGRNEPYRTIPTF